MNKRNLLPLLILVVLVIVFLIIKSNEPTEKRISFFDLDSLDITKIEMSSPADTLVLSKMDQDWMITYPVNYPPAKTKLKDFFTKVLTVETSNIPVSESETSFETYGLIDSVGTVVKLYDKDGKLLDESIVNKSSNYNYAYARKLDEKKIYQLITNVTYNMNPSLSPWRDKVVLSIEKDQISTINVAYSDSSYTLTATDTLWHYKGQGQSFPVPETNSAIKGIINNTSSLRSSSFVDGEFDKYASSFEEPALYLMVQTFDGDTYQVKFTEYEDNKYLVQKNDETEHLYVIFEYIVKLFKKSPEEFTVIQ